MEPLHPVRSRKQANRADIVFVYTPGGKSGASFRTSLGASYIRAYLLAHGINSVQLRSSLPLDVRSCVQKILEYDPKIVGFTVFFSNYATSALIARELKKFSPDITIIFGGPHATVMPGEILHDSHFADICVSGQGEETMFEIAGSLLGRNGEWQVFDPERLSDVKGIHYQVGDRILATESRAIHPTGIPLEASLDRYPSPYLSGLLSADDSLNTGVITSRGCNQNCTYCNCAVLSRRKVLFHSVDRVLAELDYIARGRTVNGIIPLMDDALTLFPTRAEKIFQGLLSNGIRLPLAITTRADYLNENLLLLMKEAGLTAIGFSLESAAPEVLRRIGKVQSPNFEKDPHFEKEKIFLDCVARYSAFAKQIGIPVVSTNIMVGLPGESLEQAQTTVDFIKKLPITQYHHNIFSIFPGTSLYTSYGLYGYKTKPYKHGRIMPVFDHPFPTSSVIKKDPRARKTEAFIRKDMRTAKGLSLLSTGTEQQPFFHRVFIFSDQIDKNFIDWLTVNLAINGSISQVFSSATAFHENHSPCLEILHSSWCSSLNYRAYVLEKDVQQANRSILESGRLLLSQDKNDGLKIVCGPTRPALEKNRSDLSRGHLYLGCEKTESDAVALYEFLEALREKPDPVHTLHSWGRLSFFNGLCKWLENGVNCRTFETALVNADGHVRFCWRDKPCGTLGNSHKTLVAAFRSAAEKRLSNRACEDCSVSKTCIRCAHPDPISAASYCSFRARLGNHSPSEWVRFIQAQNP